VFPSLWQGRMVHTVCARIAQEVDRTTD
jgi:hypothetical protein